MKPSKDEEVHKKRNTANFRERLFEIDKEMFFAELKFMFSGGYLPRQGHTREIITFCNYYPIILIPYRFCDIKHSFTSVIHYIDMLSV